ncbi:MAG TPA: bifunctional methylenetetrahydrofolate dehydrogenase/methenyltetrahydrofolate cyclohydrolase FolD [Bellilinea sp.]|nr:bifunctional methylenetetrahydrofolate dehydrogenase/methenyltetrahydrofolate cyclohydrolase FolD [Bellilinea sp.]
MTAELLDGKSIAQQVREDVKNGVAKRVAEGKSVPGLATVLVGENPASKVYVSSKQKACAEAGIKSFGVELPETATQEEVEETVRKLNADPAVSGILVQLPLPKHLDEEKILNSISLSKDVDGFHPINIGRLAQKGREPLFVPCTPYGCIHIIKTVMPSLSGANAVVLGRSNIVGMPVALLLVREDATVTICHSRSKDLPGICRSADILVAAVGRAEMVKADWVKPGAIVIDVGINSIPDATKKSGRRLVGDVDFESVKEVAGYITPVPGGVGPMTIAMLLKNTLHAAELAEK